MAGYKQKIARGFIISFVMAFAIAGLGYATRIILAKNLSLKDYGLFYAVFSFVSFFTLFRDLGFGSTAIRFISAYAAKGKKKEIKTTIMTAFFFQLAIISITTVLIVLSAAFLSNNFFKADAFYVLIFLALSYFISISQDITTTIASGFQSMLYANLSEFLRHAVIILLILFGLTLNKTALLPAMAYFLVMLVLPIVHLRIIKRFIPGFFKIDAGASMERFKEMLRFAFPVLISSIGGVIITYSDTMMITYFKTLEDVAIYNVAIPISMILWYFGNSIAAIMLPVISEMWHKGETKYVKEGIALLHKYSFAAIIPFALLFVAYPEIIIRVLFGEKFVPASMALRILSIGAIMYNVAIINSNIIVGLGEPKVNGKIMIFAAILNIILNFFMIPAYGINGAAMSTMISYALIFVMNTINIKKITKAKLPLMQYLKTILGGALFLMAVTFLKKYLVMNTYLEAIVVSLISFTIYGIYLLAVKIIDPDEIKDIVSRVVKI